MNKAEAGPRAGLRSLYDQRITSTVSALQPGDGAVGESPDE